MAETLTTATSWRDLYPVHPCADVFPMMSDAELDTLAADIKAHGLQSSVLLKFTGDAARPVAVLDGRNRLEALARLGVDIPADYRIEAKFPDGHHEGIFDIQTTTVDPAAFVISLNIHRRHLTREQRAELIVKTIEAGKPIDRAKVARSFNTQTGRKGGSTKDPVLAAAVTEGQKHGISRRTIQRARAKVQGKHPTAPRRVQVSPTLRTNAARPQIVPSPANPPARMHTPPGTPAVALPSSLSAEPPKSAFMIKHEKRAYRAVTGFIKKMSGPRGVDGHRFLPETILLALRQCLADVEQQVAAQRKVS
jgi:hypothetical protein